MKKNEKKSRRLCTNQWDRRQKKQRVGLGLLHSWRQIAFMSFFWNLWGVLMSQGLCKIFSMMILVMICMDIMRWQCFWHKWHVKTKAILQEWRFICMIWRWWKVYQDSRVMNEAITKTRRVGNWISSVIWRWGMYLSGSLRIHEIISFWELGLELQQNQMWHPGARNDKSYYLQGGGQIGSCLTRKNLSIP